MSSGLRQFLARPISALVSAFIPLEVRAPRTEQGQKWAQGLLVNVKYLKSKLGYARFDTEYKVHLPYLERKEIISHLLKNQTYPCF